MDRVAGYRPELAWTCCDHVDTLLQRNDQRDREKGMSPLDVWLTISRELGLRPLHAAIDRTRAVVERHAEGVVATVPPIRYHYRRIVPAVA